MYGTGLTVARISVCTCGSAKPTVEPHVQTEIRATVSPVPYTAVVRERYRVGKA